MSKKTTIHEFSVSNIGSARLIEDESGRVNDIDLFLEEDGGIFRIRLNAGRFKQVVYDLGVAKEFLLEKEKRK